MGTPGVTIHAHGQLRQHCIGAGGLVRCRHRRVSGRMCWRLVTDCVDYVKKPYGSGEDEMKEGISNPGALTSRWVEEKHCTLLAHTAQAAAG